MSDEGEPMGAWLDEMLGRPRGWSDPCWQRRTLEPTVNRYTYTTENDRVLSVEAPHAPAAWDLLDAQVRALGWRELGLVFFALRVVRRRRGLTKSDYIIEHLDGGWMLTHCVVREKSDTFGSQDSAGPDSDAV